MAASNIIHLRQLLAEKFPGTRTSLRHASSRHWPTGLAQVDEALDGGLPKGELTEIISSRKSSGAATLIRALLEKGATEHPVLAVVDGADSLDVSQITERTLSRLLWVRCRNSDESLKAVDLLIRDPNVSLLLIDLARDAQTARIPGSTWYRLQRLAQATSTVSVIFTSQPMVTPATARICLKSHFSLQALETDTDELLKQIECEPANSAKVRQSHLHR